MIKITIKSKLKNNFRLLLDNYYVQYLIYSTLNPTQDISYYILLVKKEHSVDLRIRFT